MLAIRRHMIPPGRQARAARQRAHWTLVAVGAFVLAGCALISPYDSVSYKNATDLKAEALFLIEKAKDPPGPHAAEVDRLQLRLRQAYEYERGKGEPNAFTVKQWEVLLDPEGSLLGGFLRKWQAENRGYGDAFLKGVSANVGKAFDEIIKLESKKVKN